MYLIVLYLGTVELEDKLLVYKWYSIFCVVPVAAGQGCSEIGLVLMFHHKEVYDTCRHILDRLFHFSILKLKVMSTQKGSAEGR
jgi:hypothetical protein